MVVAGLIPVEFLRDVCGEAAASQTLRWVLAKYESMNSDTLCNIIENLLLVNFIDEGHCHDLIVKHPLMYKLVLWMCNGATQNAGYNAAPSCKEPDTGNTT